MTDATKDTLFTILEKYGFSTLVACALLYFARQDVLLPMVETHRAFLRELSETQHEISKALTEQTRLLYAMQPRERTATVSVPKSLEGQD